MGGAAGELSIYFGGEATSLQTHKPITCKSMPSSIPLSPGLFALMPLDEMEEVGIWLGRFDEEVIQQ